MIDINRLYQFSKDITVTTDPKLLYRKIVESAKEMFELDFSTIMLLSEDKSTLTVFDTVGFSENMVGTFQLVKGQGLSTYVVMTGKPAAVADFRSETRFEVPPLVFQKDIRSALCVPMMLEDEIFGVLIGHTFKKRLFSQEETDLFQNMGNLAAVAIKNSLNMQMLKRSRDEWEMTFNAVPDLVMILGTQHRIVRINRAMAEKLGMTPDEAVGSYCYSLVHNLDVPPEFCPYSQLLADGREHACEIYEGRIGGYYWVSVTPIFDGEGRVTGSVHIARDLSEQKQVQKALDAERAFLQTVIDGLAESVLVIDMDYRVIAVNRIAREEHLDGGPLPDTMKCYQLSHQRNEPCRDDEHPCPLREVLKTKQPVTVIHKHFKTDGSAAFYELLASPVFDDSGQVVRIIEVNRDITEKLRLQELKIKLDSRIVQQQKEESIITLAGGIAHDFNNILMSVIGNAELLRMRSTLKEDDEELIRNIVVSSERMADLTKQLVAYAKGGMYHQEIVSINTLIQEALKHADRGGSSKIEIMLDLPKNLWPVLADPEQIKQVFINLFTNAFEAMEKGGGCLSVHTSNVPNKDTWECPILRHEHPKGDYVYIRISDGGHGMPEETMKRIFEPFFTTKFMGRGLGLPAAVGIIQNHNGCISVESEINKGSVFHVYLPSAEAMAKKETEKISLVKNTVGNKILVVEDEPQILELMQDMLLRMGYQVLKASDGEKALEIFRDEKDDIQMAIIDILMPGMDGMKLLKEFKAIDPEFKVLISSGYDETRALEGMASYRPEGYIQKPYRFSALKEKLSEILKDR